MNAKELKEWLKNKNDDLIIYVIADYGIVKELEFKELYATQETKEHKEIRLFYDSKKKEKKPSRSGIKTMLDLQFE